jgi:uncharacterized protein (TIGR01244 family)
MKRSLTVVVATLLALSGPPLAAQKFTGPRPTGVVPAPVLLDTTGLFLARFAKVGDDLFISGQPTEAGLRELQKRGVTTVVNLRTPSELARIGFDEPALIQQLGMTYVYLPVRGDTTYPYSPATVKAFANALANAKGKVALHCTVAWRASHLWAAYLIAERGLPVDQALANATAINLGNRGGSMTSGRLPVEQFLNRDLPTLGQTPKP